MFFERIKNQLNSFRVRLVILNTLVVLIATVGVLFGARISVRTTLQNEMDIMLEEDLSEVELAIAAAKSPHSPELLDQLDRKARGHVQHSWFCQLLELPVSETDEKAPPNPLPNSDTTASPTEWTSVNAPESWQGFPFEAKEPTSYKGFRILERVTRTGVSNPVRIRVGAFDTLVKREQSLLDRVILTALTIGLLLAPIGGYWLTGLVTQPVTAIVETTNRLRPEKLQERLQLRGTNDEMDKLSSSINYLLDRIATYIDYKRDFLANAAHELRSPLAAMHSTAELALNGERTAEEYQQIISNIIHEVESLTGLVNQLLLLAETEDFSSFSETHTELVDLSGLAAQSCDMFEPIAESKSIQYQIRIQPNVQIQGNRLHLRQIFNNLIDNALKFTPEHGNVQIELKKTNGEQPEIQFVVWDSGVGIAADELPKLFQRFYRGDRNRRRDTPVRSTGLGLSICRAVAQAHGGTIEVTSALNQGSKFVVRFPIHNLTAG
jgi:two-component system heavy metal sensor histidine kinase CusS